MRNLSIKLIFAVVMLSGFSTVSMAALAPQYQRANELNAVITAVTETLSPYQPITKIIYQKDDQYLVVAGNCSISAKIVSQPVKPGIVGARQFNVQLGKQRCKK
ncbi:hypothetical protein [Pseudochrobactrum kiredjianiae]|uniref:Uncharacterized protein n=1 Tax=Pseudochrobactrum kiredjianiae TaxID=386305 RepID=A0ABW3V8J0_9HYPH|nr:hypothetical protein [Pseudochrobactrum kiredjianiae]MDM7851514.1 hypothetical protein [Pseudochrobactrum kiredjianiae]